MYSIILPNHIADEINRRLDAAIAECPAAAPDRNHLFSQLVGHFAETGTVPEFSLGKFEVEAAALAKAEA